MPGSLKGAGLAQGLLFLLSLEGEVAGQEEGREHQPEALVRDQRRPISSPSGPASADVHASGCTRRWETDSTPTALLRSTGGRRLLSAQRP